MGSAPVTKLELAFAAAARLPASDQVALADWILQMLASDEEWDAALDRSQAALEQLAAEAREEFRARQPR
jgi:hypothetical protein